MKKVLLWVITLTFCYTSYAQIDSRLIDIEKEFNKILEVTKAPGFAVAIVEKDSVIFAAGFGYKDYENKVPMDENTLLAIGSCSKAFTCALLGQLREDGKLSFEDSPIDYIPELRFYNGELNSNVNIKDLMTHQTGIPRHDWSWYLFPTFNKDSLIQRIQFQEPFTGLRQKWYYNNFMFLTQGVIAEKITGQSWEENIKEKFFQPLNMERSNVSIKELVESDNVAIGYETYKDSLTRKMDYYKIAGMAPAGSINSSVREMANWLKVWINNGQYKGEQIIPENYIKEAISSHSIINSALPEKDFEDMYFANYGYGWMLSSYQGHYRVEHGGNIDGFSASTSFFPSDSIGIVVLANQNGSPVPSLIRNTVADRMLGGRIIDWAENYVDRMNKAKEAESTSESEEAQPKVIVSKPSHLLNEYEGEYQHPGYGKFKIRLSSDSLFADFALISMYLKHDKYDIFEPFEVKKEGIDTSDTGPLRFNFNTNDMGEISGVSLKIEPALDHPIMFKREPKIMDVSGVDLDKYTGEYTITDTKIKIYTKEDQQLYMMVPGQPEYELLPTEKDLFIIKNLEGFKVQFPVLENGTIEEVILIQPNGTFKAKKL